MTAAPSPLVQVSGLTIQRSPTFYLFIRNLEIAGGTILCAAGPNGSGKTTLIECLAGLLKPDQGSVTIASMPWDASLWTRKSLIGYIPDDEAWLIPELCAAEYFALLEDIYQQAGVTSDMATRVEHLRTKLFFTDMDTRLDALSHGNKKKVQIIAGLMHMPKVVIIDELRNGLDPLAIKAAEQLIKAEAKRGACIVAATHDLWWAERVADDMLLLIHGRPALYAHTKEIVSTFGSIESAFLKKVRRT